MERHVLGSVMVALSVLVFGCGNGTQHPAFVEEETVRAVIRNFQAAVRTENDKWACSLLAKDLQRYPASVGGECTISGYKGKDAFARAKVTRVTVSEDRATAVLDPGGNIKLQKLGDDWKISRFPPVMKLPQLPLPKAQPPLG